MKFELVETPKEEHWKARVYWQLSSKAFYSDMNYNDYLTMRSETMARVKQWCQEQEGDSIFIPRMSNTVGMAFENIADATAFVLVWSTELSALQWF
jgi:L-lactate utilization protein LutC